MKDPHLEGLCVLVSSSKLLSRVFLPSLLCSLIQLLTIIFLTCPLLLFIHPFICSSAHPFILLQFPMLPAAKQQVSTPRPILIQRANETCLFFVFLCLGHKCIAGFHYFSSQAVKACHTLKVFHLHRSGVDDEKIRVLISHVLDHPSLLTLST